MQEPKSSITTIQDDHQCGKVEMSGNLTWKLQEIIKKCWDLFRENRLCLGLHQCLVAFCVNISYTVWRLGMLNSFFFEFELRL